MHYNLKCLLVISGWSPESLDILILFSDDDILLMSNIFFQWMLIPIPNYFNKYSFKLFTLIFGSDFFITIKRRMNC